MWRSNVWALTQLQALFVLPFFIIELSILLAIVDAFVEVDGTYLAWFDTKDAYDLYSFISVAIAVVGILAAWVGAGASIALLEGRRLYGRYGKRDALSVALNRIGSLVGSGVVVLLATAATPVIAVLSGNLFVLLAGLLGAVFVASSLLATTSVVIVEGSTAGKAVARSWHLAAGRRWPLTGALLLLGLFFMAIAIGVAIALFLTTGIASSIGGNAGAFVWQAMIDNALALMIGPLVAAVGLAVYQDLLYRSEHQTATPSVASRSASSTATALAEFRACWDCGEKINVTLDRCPLCGTTRPGSAPAL